MKRIFSIHKCSICNESFKSIGQHLLSKQDDLCHYDMMVKEKQLLLNKFYDLSFNTIFDKLIFNTAHSIKTVTNLWYDIFGKEECYKRNNQLIARTLKNKSCICPVCNEAHIDPVEHFFLYINDLLHAYQYIDYTGKTINVISDKYMNELLYRFKLTDSNNNHEKFFNEQISYILNNSIDYYEQENENLLFDNNFCLLVKKKATRN